MNQMCYQGYDDLILLNMLMLQDYNECINNVY